MRLADSRENTVVRNRNNKSFYRFVRPEGDRIRIRPLELFPNGLLIEKSADTIVAGDLEVDVVGLWSDAFYVLEPAAEKLRLKYEVELIAQTGELESLQMQMETLNPKKRGSHANKIKAVQRRVDSIQAGLAMPEKDSIPNALKEALGKQAKETFAVSFKERDLVQLPSGIAGMVTQTRRKSATIAYKENGEINTIEIDQRFLIALRMRHRATI